MARTGGSATRGPALLLVVVLAATLSACTSDVSELEPDGWVRSPDDGTLLTLVAPVGPLDQVVGGRVISESPNEVRVAIAIRAGQADDRGTEWAEVTVELEEPVGDRRITTRDGDLLPVVTQILTTSTLAPSSSDLAAGDS